MHNLIIIYIKILLFSFFSFRLITKKTQWHCLPAVSHANDHIQSRVEFPLWRNFYVRTQVKLGPQPFDFWGGGWDWSKKKIPSLSLWSIIIPYNFGLRRDRCWAPINKRIEPLHMTSRPTCWSRFVQVMKNGKSWNLSISFSRPGKSWNWIVGSWKS